MYFGENQKELILSLYSKPLRFEDTTESTRESLKRLQDRGVTTALWSSWHLTNLGVKEAKKLSIKKIKSNWHTCPSCGHKF